MIKRITVSDPARTCVPWWAKVPALAARNEVTFSPRLTILWGPNGSGKSTVLRLIARMLHCEQGGTQAVTDKSLEGVLRPLHSTLKGGEVPDGACVDHDGGPVAFFDPGEAVGLLGGSFDYDFFDEGLRNTMFQGSAGQTTLNRFGAVLAMISGRTPVPPVQWRTQKLDLSRPPTQEASVDAQTSRWDEWRRTQQKWVQETLNGVPVEGAAPPRSTILLDEPERSLDMPTQASFWGRLPLFASDHQLIVATHSLFALRVPGATYIEFAEDYLARCEDAFKKSWLKFSEKG